MVVRGGNKAEAERWHQALLSHVNYKGSSVLHTYVRPQPIPKEPKLFKDIIVLDLGSSSVRAGILSAQGMHYTPALHAFPIALRVINANLV